MQNTKPVKVTFLALALTAIVYMPPLQPAHAAEVAPDGNKPHPKPATPLRIDLQAAAPLVFDGINPFVVSFSSTVALTSANVQLHDAPAKACTGQTQWSGPLLAGQTQTFRFSCFIPAHASGFLEVEATAQVGEAASAGASSRFTFGTPAQKSLSGNDNSRVVKDNGRGLREYTLP